MQSLLSAIDMSGVLPLVSTLCHMATAAVAVTSGAITYRYTKQQSALSLLNHQHILAQSVHAKTAPIHTDNVVTLFQTPQHRHRSAA